jgi:hypothetical protein
MIGDIPLTSLRFTVVHTASYLDFEIGRPKLGILKKFPWDSEEIFRIRLLSNDYYELSCITKVEDVESERSM